MLIRFSSIAIFTVLGLSSTEWANAQIFRNRGYQPPAQQYSNQNRVQYQNPPANPTQTNALPGNQVPGNQVVGQPLNGQVINGQPVSGANIVPNANRVNAAPTIHWSQKILENVVKDHDFGTVAKASNQRHLFEFTNTLDTDLQLTNARVSCGCTKVQILTPTVKPGEKGQIEARFDTLGFVGQRGATVTVSVNKNRPYNEYSEIRFSVKGMIRSDVVFDPGIVDFGDVAQGNATERKVLLKYAGNTQWKVENVSASNPYIEVSAKEVNRNPNNGRVDYELALSLKPDAPAGSIADILTIKTSDYNNALISLPISGRIDTPISVADIQLGLLNRGGSYEKKLVISSKQPFEIEEIKSSNPKLEFQPVSGSKTLHIVSYKFNAENEGLIADKIVIRTNHPSQPQIEIGFGAQVVEQTMAVDK